MTPGSQRKAAIAILALLGGGLLIWFWPDVRALLARVRWADIEQTVREAGPWAPVLCIVLDAVFTVFSLPTTLVGVLIALLYPIVWGLLLCLIGLGLGMSATFLLARYLLRDWLARRIGHTRLFGYLEANMRREGWKVVLFTRLLPINPFSFLNYAYGLTSIPFHHYLLASVIGVIPNVLALLWTVRAAGQLARGQADWRVLAILFAGAGLFAIMAWLPKLLRKNPSLAQLPLTHNQDLQADDPPE